MLDYGLNEMRQEIIRTAREIAQKKIKPVRVKH